MNDSPFKLYVDRLKNDDTENIFETVSPDYFQMDEQELTFKDEVIVSGQAYLAKNHLILDLKIKAKALLPCSICNQSAETPLNIDDFNFTLDLTEVNSAIYDYSEDIRGAILLKAPHFLECSGGHCPNRREVSKYLRKDTNTPFENLLP